MSERLLLDHTDLSHTLDRLAYQVYERHDNLKSLALISLQPRGVFLGQRIAKRVRDFSSNQNLNYGELDITFYRDDIRMHDTPLVPSSTNISFNLEGKSVVLVDDVLYTGRTVRAALDALLDFGRPASVELLVLIDRRYSREVPVQPDFVGRVVNVVSREKVRVLWSEDDSNNSVRLLSTDDE